MDTSNEQDQRIMEYQRQLSAGHIDEFEQRKIKEQIKNVQRLLKPITVKNPFATYLKLPDEVFKPRRTMLLLLLFTETITWYHQYQRELKTDTDTGEQYIETTLADVETAFALLETTLLKKSDELNDACRTFFEKLKALLKEQDTESFYSKEIRAAFRITPSSIQRYLYELERMGYIKITRGNRYKGFEYKIQSWDDLEKMQDNAQNMVKGILENIRSVTRNPSVAQSANGLHKVQKASKKQAVTQTE
jgi:predicted transcriptional regulator